MRDAYRLYLGFEFAMSAAVGVAQATIMVYWVTASRLDPLQLVLLGTMIEAAYFLLQLPTGLLADLVSRRLCVVAGVFATGLGFVVQGLSTAFASLLAAQVLIALGAALMYGAQESWLADELAERATPQVYVRAGQIGLAGTIVGSVGSGFLALAGLKVPLLAGGALIVVIAAVLAVVMPERNFRRPAATATAAADAGTRTGTREREREETGIETAGADVSTVDVAQAAAEAHLLAEARAQGRSVPRARTLAREAGGVLVEQLRSTNVAVRAVPGLVLVFGMTFFTGMWSESFDRLWGDFLLHDIRFPDLFGLWPAMWFSLLSVAVALLALGTTELAGRRTERLGPASVTSTLLVLTAAIAVGVVVMGAAHAFGVFIVAYLVISALRPVSEPLVTGWMVGRVRAEVRATALSARDMCDCAGQIVGGPAIGAVGNLVSVRAALLAGAAALVPAMGLLSAAARRVRATRPALVPADATDTPALGG